MTLPAALRPYAALLQSGMGGFSGATIDHLCGLTPKQVAAWYADAIRQAAPVEAESPAAGRMTYAEFREQFGSAPQYRDQPEAWWREKWQEFNREG